MQIFFGADYNGEKQKNQLKNKISEYGKLTDISEDKQLDNYIKISSKVSEIVVKNKAFGVLMCGSGTGECIVANKVKQAYAVSCIKPEQAVDAKIINNANILCLAKKTPLKTNLKIIEKFFETKYAGRKPERLEEIAELEKKNFK